MENERVEEDTTSARRPRCSATAGKVKYISRGMRDTTSDLCHDKWRDSARLELIGV